VLDRVARDVSLIADPTVPTSERVRLASSVTARLDSYLANRPVPVNPAAVAGTVAGGRRSRAMSAALRQLVEDYDVALHDELLPALAGEGAQVLDRHAFDGLDSPELRRTFLRTLHPLLTPMTVDATHPFPRVPARGIHLAVRVHEPGERRDRFVCIPVPAVLPRCFDIGEGRFVPAESAVCALLPDVLTGLQVAELACFRVTRSEYVERVRSSVARRASRPLGRVVRLEVERSATPLLLEVLTANLSITPDEIWRVRSSLAMGPSLSQFSGIGGLQPSRAPSEERR
jgi:polyphosphate kinase